MSLQGQVPLSAVLAGAILAACFSPAPGAAAQGTSTRRLLRLVLPLLRNLPWAPG